uniref:Uncharacterized protein n=1 Tax=Rhizophora mucronata TaxID=61149 RepID=A0A2P2QM84_RHIMU
MTDAPTLNIVLQGLTIGSFFLDMGSSKEGEAFFRTRLYLPL